MNATKKTTFLGSLYRNKSVPKRRANVTPTFESLEDRMLMDHALASLALQHEGDCDHVPIACADHDHEQDHFHGVYDSNYEGPIPAEFVQTGIKWTGGTLTYSYSNLLDGGVNGLTAGEIKSAIEEALRLWSDYAPLHFVETADSGPSVSDQNYFADSHPQLRFGHHYYDGSGSVLAHAYFPDEYGLAGDVHFDDGEYWTAGKFLEVAVHEIGHALGLEHEPNVDAIMNPAVKDRFGGLGAGYLLQDDINGIQSLYGSGTGSVTPLNQGGSSVPSPIGPQGTTNDATPTFQWNSASGATWYYLYVENNSTGDVFTTWVEGQTSYTMDSSLAGGDYTFWVLGWGNGQYGEWSEGMNFHIEAATPDTATLIGPNGTTGDMTPTFQWNTANGASWYYLYVRNDDTSDVFTTWVEGQTSYTMDTSLAAGSYTFWVNTWGNGVYGEWSQGMQFEIERVTLGITTLIGPGGTTNDNTPTLQWNAVSNATWYYVYLYNRDTQTVETQEWVQGNTSYTHSSSLASGNYTFWILAWGNDEYGDWSEGMDFSIV